jgi:hypothetical protein
MNERMLEETSDLLRLAMERQLTADEVKTLCAATGVKWAWVTNRSTKPKQEQCLTIHDGSRLCALSLNHEGPHIATGHDGRRYTWWR